MDQSDEIIPIIELKKALAEKKEIIKNNLQLIAAHMTPIVDAIKRVQGKTMHIVDIFQQVDRVGLHLERFTVEPGPTLLTHFNTVINDGDYVLIRKLYDDYLKLPIENRNENVLPMSLQALSDRDKHFLLFAELTSSEIERIFSVLTALLRKDRQSLHFQNLKICLMARVCGKDSVQYVN